MSHHWVCSERRALCRCVFNVHHLCRRPVSPTHLSTRGRWQLGGARAGRPSWTVRSSGGRPRAGTVSRVTAAACRERRCTTRHGSLARLAARPVIARRIAPIANSCGAAGRALIWWQRCDGRLRTRSPSGEHGRWRQPAVAAEPLVPVTRRWTRHSAAPRGTSVDRAAKHDVWWTLLHLTCYKPSMAIDQIPTYCADVTKQ